GADAVQVPEDVYAEAGDVWDRVGEIRGVVPLELLEGRAAHQPPELGAQLLVVELLVLHRDELSVHPHPRRVSRDEMKIRALAQVHAAQQIVDQGHPAASATRSS